MRSTKRSPIRFEESANDWEKIEAIYDAVLKKIDYVEGPDKSAVEALHDKQADCQGRSALFIALCRLNKVPARMVWVHGHCYPEFYMEHAEGEGYWYPCESAGTRAFGEMPLARTILQKGRQLPRARAERKAPLRVGLYDRPADARRRQAASEVHSRNRAAKWFVKEVSLLSAGSMLTRLRRESMTRTPQLAENL